MKGILKKSSLISGILFALIAIMHLIISVEFELGDIPWKYFYVVPFGIISFSLLSKRDGIIVGIGFIILTLLKLRAFIVGFSYNLYSVVTYTNVYDSSIPGPNFACILPSLIEVAGYFVATMIVISCKTDLLPGMKNALQKIWYVPTACILIKIPLVFIIASAVGGYWIGSQSVHVLSWVVMRIFISVAILLCILAYSDRVVDSTQIDTQTGIDAMVKEEKANEQVENEIEVIIDQNNPNSADNLEEIRKYKALLDEGVITDADFQKKKKDLLGL